MAIQSNYPAIRPSLNLDFANSKQLDPRITFTRASTATYYDGKTMAKAEENLLLNSATLATQNVTVTAQAYTLSFENTGTVTLSGASTAGPLVGTGVSNRVSLTFTPTAGTLTLTVSGTVTNAQLEARASATAYTPTTTQPITNYIPALQTALAGVPRFEHNPLTGESLGLEIEEQRANLLTYSDAYSDSSWVKTRLIVSANVIIAPDGTLTGDKIVEDTTSSNTHMVGKSTTTTAASHTFSVYAKAGERISLMLYHVESNVSMAFNLSTVASIGSLGLSSPKNSSITSVGNGWYRCSITATATAASNTFRTYLVDGTQYSYTGDGVSGLYLWGAQLEAGAFATSYIPTVASQVTRSADAASMTGTNFSSWFRQDEGTICSDFFPVGIQASTGTGPVYSFSDGTSSNRIRANLTGGSAILTADIAYSGVAQVANTRTAPFNSAAKHALSYNKNDSADAFNGSSATADTVCLIPVITQFQIGTLVTTGQYTGTIKRIAYYPKRLTNAQLQAITS